MTNDRGALVDEIAGVIQEARAERWNPDSSAHTAARRILDSLIDPLSTLRAEVERLRDEAEQTHKKASQAVSMYWHRQNYDSWAASQTLSNQYHAATNHALASAYTTVLDLIDKRCGQ